MDEVVLRSLQRLATTEEEARLRAWRRNDSENERRYREFVRVWGLTGEAAPAANPSARPSFAKVMERARLGARVAVGAVEDAPVAGKGPPPAYAPTTPVVRAGPADSRRSGRWRPLARRGAAVLLAASLAGLALFHLAHSPEERSALVTVLEEVRTGPGEFVTVTLPDGTGIHVGPESRLRVWRDGRDDIAELEGRAFFGVRSDQTRRFRVRTPSGEVTVRGTRFEVRSDKNEFDVLVVDGRVRVAAADASVELGEAAMSRATSDGTFAVTEVEDVYSRLAWMGRSLVFQATPLPRALEEIERRLGLRVHLADEEFAAVTVTATFADQTSEEVILVLCGLLTAECTVDGDRAIIGSNPHITSGAPIQ